MRVLALGLMCLAVVNAEGRSESTLETKPITEPILPVATDVGQARAEY
jgi:hypothetical protein